MGVKKVLTYLNKKLAIIDRCIPVVNNEITLCDKLSHFTEKEGLLRTLKGYEDTKLEYQEMKQLLQEEDDE